MLPPELLMPLAILGAVSMSVCSLSDDFRNHDATAPA
jgi:hypothetical protein